jgi:hypothetical protein
MRYLTLSIAIAIVSCSAVGAWAQYGLYGAPDVLRLPQTQSDALPPQVYGNYANADADAPVVSTTRVAPAPVAGQDNAAAAMDPRQKAEKPSRRNRATVPAEAAERPAVERDATVDRMLRAAGPCDEPPSASPGSVLGEACGAEPCVAPCAVARECPWFASANWLIMGRDKSNRVWTTFQADYEPNQLMHSWHTKLEWESGGEVRLGRRFCCDQWGLEAVYWTLNPMTGFASMSHSHGVSTPLRVSEIEFDGVNGHDLFDGAEEHRLWRRDEFHNVELNLIRYASAFQFGCPWDIRWTGGARFFRFEESLRFGSLDQGYEWGQGGGIHEAYLRDEIKNNLIGVQVGCDARYAAWENIEFFLAPKVGVYNNRIENRFEAYRGDGVDAVPTAASHMTEYSYPVVSHTDVFSVLTEVNVGLAWNVTQNWSAQVGYRLMVGTGIGLADHQIPTYIVDVPEIAAINRNGNLLLHGAFAGITYNY